MTDKLFNLYQLSKINGIYWWTSTVRVTKNELLSYKENDDYLWTTNKQKASELSGKPINH